MFYPDIRTTRIGGEFSANKIACLNFGVYVKLIIKIIGYYFRKSRKKKDGIARNNNPIFNEEQNANTAWFHCLIYSSKQGKSVKISSIW